MRTAERTGQDTACDAADSTAMKGAILAAVLRSGAAQASLTGSAIVRAAYDLIC